MKATNILVVRGAGYIGAHTCKALRSAGFVPVVFDNLSTGHRDFVKWGPLVEGDIRDPLAIADAITAYQTKAVSHFAACAYVGESVTNPQKYYDNNVFGSLSLLRAMLSTDCNKLVFSSTCAVYGEPEEVPISETTIPNPVNPYGASKLMIERILRDYKHAYGLNSIALRYFNASGADPDGELGELRDPETHLIPRAMMSLQGHISDFEVFGTDYETPDGTAIRDYIHVSDLATAHVMALRLLLNGNAGGTYNLGTGKGYSVKEVLEAITVATGKILPPISGGRRPGDPPILSAEVLRAKAELGFSPIHSDLETIIKTAWSWHSKMHPRMDDESTSVSKRTSI